MISLPESEPEELPEVRLEVEQDSRFVDVDLVPLVTLVLSEGPNSLLTNAARTSEGRDVHASRIEAERVAVGFEADASSLYYF